MPYKKGQFMCTCIQGQTYQVVAADMALVTSALLQRELDVFIAD